MKFNKSQLVSLVAIITVGATTTFAEKANEPSKEQRAKMAAMHDKMASCLRSDKTVEECRNEMRTMCEQSEMDCPMGHMGHNKMMHKKMRNGKKSDTNPPAADKE